VFSSWPHTRVNLLGLAVFLIKKIEAHAAM
jgi:hypothetical protein